ncbi:hypothetical protein [Bradyrhizobium sp. Cp5.3]|uniref:hypothetical protein n=1 Tax=Bradyrhizobium sp. Cp5.3 TaxID=443598 RepID=UPI0018DDA291|nr:hypothetical protein [Bradyrhizobium sp. Cp5.3]
MALDLSIVIGIEITPAETNPSVAGAFRADSMGQDSQSVGLNLVHLFRSACAER